MAKNNNLTDFLTDVADAIRTKKGTSGLIDPQDFSSEIASIPSGGTSKLPEVIDKSVTQITASDLGQIRTIGNYTFQSCTALTSVVIPNTVTSIGDSAFYNCYYLTNLTIPNTIKEIGVEAFGRTAISNITLPNTLTHLRNGAFRDCRYLLSLTIPSSVGNIPTTICSGCQALTTVIFENNSMTKVGNSSFAGCSALINVTLPTSLITIGDSAFNNCTALTNINIPSTVSTIGTMAFYSCPSLINLKFSNALTRIQQNAFAGSSSLNSITIEATNPPVLDAYNAFNNTNNCPIYVPAESVTDYQTATNWSSLASRIQAIPSV